METLNPIRYQPPEAEIDLEQVVEYNAQELADQYLSDKQKEVDEIQMLIDRYDLINELSKYLEKLIDKELDGVNIQYSPDEFPDLYMCMKGMFPEDADSFRVTYDQYKKCFDFLMEMSRSGVY